MNIAKRLSNFELLRIIAIVMITFHHIALNTEILNIDGINSFIGNFLVIGGKIGVNIFVLISGYFLCEKEIKISKVLKLCAKIFFYSIVLVLVSILIFGDDIGIFELFTYFLPVIFKKWWFVTAFIGMYILAPFINLIIKNMNCKLHKILVIVLSIILTIIPTFTNMEPFYSDLVWFIYLYFISSYIKKYVTLTLKNKKPLLLYSVTIYLIIFASIIVFGYLGKSISIFKSAQYYFISQTNILILAVSITIFLYFSLIKIKDFKIINNVSKHTFGVYLIQSHPFFNKHIYEFLNSILLSNLFWVNSIIYIVLLFIVSIILDNIQEVVLDKTILNKINSSKIFKKVEDNINLIR